MTNASYIIFEADQVLTNEHLNNLFTYLDTQERLTRNKLIGVGIVCGLEIDYATTGIQLSKGCGVTSKGYLVVQEETVLTQYIPYTVPAVPLYKPFIKESTGKQYNLWRLLNDDDAKKTEGASQAITLPAGFINNKVVVLFLEANEIDLKNCDTQDCNEKGRQMELTVRALLIDKADIEEIIIKQKKLSGEDDLSDSYIERLGLKDVYLKRFDVKATPLVDAFDIYAAYLKCLDETALNNVADVYSQSYSIFKSILPDYANDNPFKNLATELKAKLESIKKSMPLYIQYYYDFVDDLIKAYQEFREKSFEVVTECCPDEDLFPMHLMLGEAAVDTRDYIRSPFRQYFVSSPLFNQQQSLLTDTRLLFERMVQLVKQFFIPQFNLRQPVPIRITPSRWSRAPLSARSIPYYYNINNVARSWNAGKTGKGKANYNLGYNADKYNPLPPEPVQVPLNYSIEQYDFYRVEGHIGQEYTTVLNAVLNQRNSYRLPFDVIALKAGSDADNTEIKYTCHFEDLETGFALLKAELACKIHEPLCFVAKIPTTLKLAGALGDTQFKIVELISGSHELEMTEIVNKREELITSFISKLRFTRKGDFLKTYCRVKDGTLGGDYIKSGNKFFPRPAAIDLTTTAGSKAAFMHLIDIIEALMQTITTSSTIYSFNFVSFSKLYKEVVSYITDVMKAIVTAEGQERKINPLFYGMLEAVVNSCLDERLKALTDEYTRRVEKVQKQNLLSEYLKSNPAIDHKAGVPRGGTFVIVYHETPPEKDRQTITNVSNTISRLDTISEVAVESRFNARLADTSTISTENVSKLVKLIDTKELGLNATQANALKKAVLQRFTAVGERDPFTIPDKAVVADFYLPYLCCSDCPPVTYVLPKEEKPPVGLLSISLSKTEFCNIDKSAYKITVSPAGGTLTASAGGVDNDKQEFKPSEVAPGINKITYTLADGRSTSVDVKVVAAFDIDFTFEPIATSPFSIQFKPSTTDNKPVSWNFGDGTPASTDGAPLHTYQLTAEEQSFLVKLTVVEGPCNITKEHSITLKKPRPQLFSIKPTVFCWKDDRVYPFTIDPAVGDLNEISNPDGLKLQKEAAGNVTIKPFDQQMDQTQTFNLNYKGIAVSVKLIVPDAGFTMNVQRGAATIMVPDTFITLKARQTDADNYRWTVTTDTGAVHKFTEKEVKFGLGQLQIAVRNQISIVLEISYEKQTGATCSDKKDYNLTAAILKNHLNKGEFDNVTPA